MVTKVTLINFTIQTNQMDAIKTSGVVLIEQPGAANVLKYKTITLPPPGSGEVLINQKAIGVNFLDVFLRNGTFPIETYPSPVGMEAAGVIEQIGSGVNDFAVGDRVAYHSSFGAYTEKRILRTGEIFKLPDDISFDQAAAVMVKGLTVHMLVKQSHEIKAGEVVLIHAVTGGVGTLLSQWIQSAGATVIGTVGSAAKRELALQRGLKNVIDLQSEDVVAKVNEFTQGTGVDVVYDSIGEATFNKCLPLVKEGGSAVLYGWASGMPVVDNALIEQRKIHFVHPALNDYLTDRIRIKAAMVDIFEWLREGVLDVQKPSVYSLADAAIAHADLESRKTTGSIILRP